jgi:DNA-binding transcriptional regulator YiaG
MANSSGAMTSQEFKDIRKASGLSLNQLTELLGMASDRPLRRIEDEEQSPSGPISLCMKLLRDGRLADEVKALREDR